MVNKNSFLPQYNIDLNAEQEMAVKHVNGPVLVLAGPGSGKTTVITARVANLIINKGIAPESILTLTFNRAAKNEMELRFNRIFGEELGQRVRFSTLHSFCNAVLVDYEKKQGKRFKRIEGTDEITENKRSILRTIYLDINGRSINDDEMEELINHIGLVKNKMIKDFDEIEDDIKKFNQIFYEYEKYKKARRYMDFDDMLTYAYMVLVKCPDILLKYKDRYKYIQVDEGQDLSKIQFEIIKLLMNKNENNIFLVADDDQSIYGFRGSEPKYILEIKKYFNDCKKILLKINYRSTKNIVDITSDFIRNNKVRFEKEHNSNNFELENPKIIKLNNDEDQLEYILKIVNDALEENRESKIAILYRNNLSSINIINTLNTNNISFKIKQNKALFFKHWAVQDILAMLEFAINDTNKEAFIRIYYKLGIYISKSLIEQYLKAECKDSIIDLLLKDDTLKIYQKKTLKDIKKKFRKLGKKQPYLAFEYLENEFDYLNGIKEYCEKMGISFGYFTRIFEILKNISKGYTNLVDFINRIDELELILQKSGAGSGKNYVTLTTMHSSKGLEYDVVLMIDLINEETPGTKAFEMSQMYADDTLMEEERRLFYVAMTRAKKNLYLTYPSKRSNRGVTRSKFIDEVTKCINKYIVDKLGEGVIIQHKKFGRGVVVNLSNDSLENHIAEIDFNKKIKKLNLEMCIQQDLIKLEE